MKTKKLYGRLLISSLIGFGMIAPAVASSVSAISVRAEDGINVVVDFNSLSFITNSDSYLAFSQPANDQPGTGAVISGTNNFFMENGGQVKRADGTVEEVTPCIAKEGDSYNIYFNSYTWSSTTKFTVNVGDTLVIRKGTWVSPTGHSLTFSKDLIAERTSSGYKIGVANKVSYSFGLDDLSVTGNDSVFYLQPLNADLSSLPFNGEWGTVLRATNAVTHTPAGGEPVVIEKTGTCVIGGKLCFQTGTGWTGVKFYITVGVGDKIALKGTYSLQLDDTLYEITLDWEATWNGSTWKVDTIDEAPINYNDNNIVSVSTQVEDPITYYFLSVIVDEDDDFPIDTSWNANYVVTNGAVITPADGSDPITMSIRLLKNGERKYSMLMMKKYWPNEAYDWNTGDNIKINGSISAAKGIHNYTVNISNWNFTWDGSRFVANFNRQELIQKVIAQINALGEPSLDSAWVAKLNEAKQNADRLTNVEAAQIDSAILAKLYQAQRAYRYLLAEHDGKTVHKTELTNVTTTMTGNSFTEGIFVNYPDDTMDFAEYAGSWLDYYSGSTNDVKVTNADGSKTTFLTSAMVNDAAEKNRYSLIFIKSWGPRNGYDWEAGDRVEVSPTGYIAETETDLYLLETPAIDAIWCGAAWMDYKDGGEQLQEFINAVKAIGTVELTSECKAKIDAAKALFNALDESITGRMDDDTLAAVENAQKAYDALANAQSAQEIVDLIDNIGTVEYTPACKAKIDAAREAYDSATSEVRALISDEKVKVLTDAEAEYARLGNQIAANAVEELINAIGTVEYTAECKAKIDAAREAYDALSDDAKEMIADATYQVLLDAEARYDVLKAEDDFVQLVNTLSDDMTPDKLYSTITRALSMYRKIENKDDVADAYAKLLTYIEKYNAAIGSVNTAHEEANDAAVNMVGLAVAAPSLVALAAYALSKKGLL